MPSYLSRAVAAILAVVACSAALAQSAPPDGFTALFNGKDLSGWEGDNRLWSVKDGEIVGSTEGVKLEQNSFLFATKQYTDFTLLAKVKLRNHNSGIQFRSERRDGFVAAGYQADVAEKTYFGMLYEERKRGILPYWNALSDAERAAIFAAAKLNDWNQYEITCQGHHVKIVLNGVTTLDFDDPDGASAGFFALQLHAGPGMQVNFKDIYVKELGAAPQASNDPDAPLLPDYDKIRSERLTKKVGQFIAPEGFVVEEVASNELIGSVVNMTFDQLGRPVMAAERAGLRILVDENGDGVYDSQKYFCEELTGEEAKAAGGKGEKYLQTVHGLCYLGPNDVLANANGPKGSGLYRVRDLDGDDKADDVKMIMPSNGGIGEHGPHTVRFGADGYLYVMYGNHAHPDVKLDPMSPSRDTQEDSFLPPYYDPRGHAVNIRVPGGTIQRLSPNLDEWSETVSGFRNAFDFDIDSTGEMFTFDSDMEWDVGLPWWRAIRTVHCIPGGDYGWRTGSYNMPSYFIGTLPPTDDVGRGSPVGTCFYEANAYPERFRGAFFQGDWSRGRIRVMFPRHAGGTYAGKTMDFIIGEPMNVTDMDIGPDGNMYFAIGGRGTNGGLYRVRWTGAAPAAPQGEGILKVVDQIMPRSAWGRKAILDAKAQSTTWVEDLHGVVRDADQTPARRLAALEILQVHGPQPTAEFLMTLLGEKEPLVRAQAAYLLGLFPLAQTREPLVSLLADSDAFVQRRACESLVRGGLSEAARIQKDDALVANLFALLDSPDRFVRYAAGLALRRVYREAWAPLVMADDITRRPHGALEGLVQLIFSEKAAPHSDAIFAKLEQYSAAPMAPEILLDYLRTLQLAFIRDVVKQEDKSAFMAKVGPGLLAKFPSQDWRVNRELQAVLAFMNVPGTSEALLKLLTPDRSQEEQIWTVYCLRVLKEGWTPEQRKQLAAWFDRAWEMGGGASFEGHIEFLWQDTLKLMTADERGGAEAHKAEFMRKRQEAALANQMALENGAKVEKSDLAQMGFQELAEYLEYDPGAYRANLVKGKDVFVRSKCAACHVFGNVGKGGGPDLSTVVSRFRRRDILEAIMYPSKVVSDQYIGVRLELNDLSDVTGMIAAEGDDSLALITTDGVKQEIKKADIAKREDATTSIMPEGLLNTMTMEDLIALINYLERGGEEK